MGGGGEAGNEAPGEDASVNGDVMRGLAHSGALAVMGREGSSLVHGISLSGSDGWGWCSKGGDESGGDGAVRSCGACDILVVECEDG